MSFWTMSLENVNEAVTVRPCPDEDAETFASSVDLPGPEVKDRVVVERFRCLPRLGDVLFSGAASSRTTPTDKA
ncbi:hypothetical protein MRX96_036530 [Rhipicephalus microplus]